MTRSIRPWRPLPLDDVYQEMDNLVQHFFGDDGGNGAKSFVPRINVAETDESFEVTADLPGIDPNDVTVEVHENRLTMSGKRASESSDDSRKFHRVERRWGTFQRVVELPDTVDRDRITADYQHGVLVVSLPKMEKLKPTRIPIGSGKSAT
jgi:HSP20 family protein